MGWVPNAACCGAFVGEVGPVPSCTRVTKQHGHNVKKKNPAFRSPQKNVAAVQPIQRTEGCSVQRIL